jgi:hypothetical protein
MDEIKELLTKAFILGALGIIALTIIIGLFFGIGYFSRQYDLWAYEMEGKAELAKAEWDRKIHTVEAVAKKDSAKALAEAEVIRAEGVAKANQIIGESLKQNETYLRYLWIQTLDHEHNKVIYVPTEANLPILEATRNTK